MSSAKTTIPTVECEVIGNIDWNCFIHDFMKEIHIIEIKPKEREVYYLTYIYLHKPHESRIFPPQREST